MHDELRTEDSTQDVPLISHDSSNTGQDMSCTRRLDKPPEVIQIQEQEDEDSDSSTQSETRHAATPTESYSPLHGEESLNLQDMTESREEKSQGMKVRDPDHSLSQFTTYQPRPENSEVRYGRSFVVPLYGRDDHRYYLPVDEEAAERSAIGHRCWMDTTKLLCVGVYSGTILDLGTGDGAWVQEVAQMKPECKVIGVDLYYFDLPEAPKQAEFVVDDCELELAMQEETVTMVNMRDSFLWVRDLDGLMMRIYDILGLNGCFQCQEIRLSEWTSNKPKVCQWKDKVLACATELGIQLHSASDMRQALIRHGFREYSEECLTWTIDKIPELREYFRLTVMASVRILYDAPGQSAAASDDIIRGAIEELQADDCQIEIGVDVCWARKTNVFMR